MVVEIPRWHLSSPLVILVVRISFGLNIATPTDLVFGEALLSSMCLATVFAFAPPAFFLAPHVLSPLLTFLHRLRLARHTAGRPALGRNSSIMKRNAGGGRVHGPTQVIVRPLVDMDLAPRQVQVNAGYV